jgi:acetyl-CoA/propionyl-CoA carboxylase carboxyl transferase subunit
VLANNPLRLGGCLNSESAEKAARFVRLCNAFGIPLVVVVDVPGYLPGVDQEWGGVVRRGAKLLHAFGEATVPRVTLVTRKIYGGAYIAMNSRSLNATKVYAWPEAEVAVMGAKAAVGILHKKKLAAAADHERDALHEELAAEHERIAGGVDSAIEIGVVDDKIDPAHTRSVLTQALAEAPARAAGTRTSRCNRNGCDFGAFTVASGAMRKSSRLNSAAADSCGPGRREPARSWSAGPGCRQRSTHPHG